MRILILLFNFVFISNGYNFLVYSPLFGHSHSTFMGALADILTEAGHNVTYLAPVLDYRVKGKYAVKKTTHIITLDVNEEMKAATDVLAAVDYGKLWTGSGDIFALLNMAEKFRVISEESCRLFYENAEIHEELSKIKYDAFIHEPFSVCILGMVKHLKIPTIMHALSLSSFDSVSYYIGEPLALSYVPSQFTDADDKMDLLMRAKNVLQSIVGMRFAMRPMDEERKTIKKMLGIDIGKLEEYYPEAPFVFTNSNPYFDFPHPVLAKNIQIGGVTLNLTQLRSATVDEEYDEVLNRRSKNVLVSFGSMVKSKDMPDNYKIALVEAFKKHPDVTFIWKYENNETSFADGVENVYFSTWVPQTALLNDERLTAFVTHGGLGSTTELAYLGKPAIMIPIFGDQPRNCHMLARQGGVIKLTWEVYESPENL